MAMAADGDATTVAAVLAGLNLAAYAHMISEEGFESANDLAELTDDEATALGGDLGMKRGEVRPLATCNTTATTDALTVAATVTVAITTPP